MDVTALSHQGHSGVENVVSRLAANLDNFSQIAWDMDRAEYTDNRTHSHVDLSLPCVLFVPDIPRLESRIKKISALVVLNKNLKLVLLVHDLLPLNYPEFFPTESNEIFQDYLKLLNIATRIICVSKDTKSSCINYFRKNNFAVPQIVVSDLPSTPTAHGDIGLVAMGKRHVNILVLGNFEPRKNLDLIFDNSDLFSEFFVNCSLTFVGAHQWDLEAFPKKVELLKEKLLEVKVYHGASALQLDLIWLDTDLLIYPSKAEGFGLPVMEGLYRNVPVIANSYLPSSTLARDNERFFGIDTLDREGLRSALKLVSKTKFQTSWRAKLIGKAREDSDWRHWAKRVLSELTSEEIL